MNPYTGDSYAYFNCGHNFGEEGMILPGRPNPQSPEEKAVGRQSTRIKAHLRSLGYRKRLATSKFAIRDTTNTKR